MFYLASIYIYIYIYILNYICMHVLRHYESLKMCKKMHKCINNKVKCLNEF